MMRIPLIPVPESLFGIQGLSEFHIVVAFAFAAIFVFLAVLDLSFLSLGGNIAKEKARQALWELSFAVLSLIFGLYFIGPLLTLFILGFVIWFVISVIEMFKIVFNKDDKSRH